MHNIILHTYVTHMCIILPMPPGIVSSTSLLTRFKCHLATIASYGIAQFKLHTCVCITHVYLVTPVEHF